MANKLPDNFPGRAALEAAGEFTPAKLRKRIAAGTLKEIPGIAEAHEEKIIDAFEAFDSPDQQAKEVKEVDDTDDAQAASDEKGGTVTNPGGPNPEALAKGLAESEKSGAQKNEELANHALDQPTGGDMRNSAIIQNDSQRLAMSGIVVVDDPRGQYVSKPAPHIDTAKEGRIKVLPLGHTSPVKGMEIRDGDDVYVLGEEFARRDLMPADWLRVRNPNTGVPLVD